MIFTPTPENPENTPDHLKAALTAAIAKVVHESYPTDKYRSRKLDFETLTQLLITMDGGSIAKELLSAGLDASASAFVQRRKRFEWRILSGFWRNSTKCAKIPPHSKATACSL